MVSELSVIVKNEEKRQTTKHLIYEAYCVDENDATIMGAISDAVKQFQAEPDNIQIKINLAVR